MRNMADPGPSPDDVRSAIALGLEVTARELAVLQREHASGPIVDRVQDQPELAVESPRLAPELRRYFARSRDRRLALAAGCHAAAPEETVRAVLARQDIQVLISTAPERIPPHCHPAIALHGHPRLHIAIARTTDQEPVIRLLAESPDRSVRVALAANRNASSASLHRLASDDDPGVRAAMARRPALARETLDELVSDESAPVRAGIAAKPGLDRTLVVQLAGDPDWTCRRAVASNRSSGPEVLARLATDSEARVRAAVATNRRTPPDLLGALVRDPESTVRHAAARNRAIDGDRHFFAAIDGVIPDFVVVANPTAPADALTRIADRSVLLGGHATASTNDRTVLLELARHPNLTPALARRLRRWCETTSHHDEDRRQLVGRVAARLEARKDRRRRDLGDAAGSTRTAPVRGPRPSR